MYRPIAAIMGLVFLVLSVFSGQHFLRDVSLNAQMDLIHSISRDLLIALLNAETGQRGFIITGNEAYLRPYVSSIGNVDDELTLLEHAIDGKPHADEVRELRPIVKRKVDELALTIDKRRTSEDEAAKEVNNHLGMNLMSDIRAHLSLIDLWAERETKIAASNASTYARVSFGSMVLSLFFGIIATFHPNWWKPE